MSSNTLTLDKNKAIELHKNGTAEERALLEKLWGAASFQPDIMEQLEQAKDEDEAFAIICQVAKRDPARYVVTDDMDREIKYGVYCSMVALIANVLNKGWQPDWSDNRQYKYFPYFIHDPAGFGFSHSFTHYVFTDANVGSRFASASIAAFAGKRFVKLFTNVINHAQ